MGLGFCSAVLAAAIGGLSEAKYGAETAETIACEGLGSLTVLFVGPWTGEKIRAVGEVCLGSMGYDPIDRKLLITSRWFYAV